MEFGNKTLDKKQKGKVFDHNKLSVFERVATNSDSEEENDEPTPIRDTKISISVDTSLSPQMSENQEEEGEDLNKSKNYFIRKYSDFTTIDWIHDQILDKKFQKKISTNIEKNKWHPLPQSFFYKLFSFFNSLEFIVSLIYQIQKFWYNFQGWILITFLGISIGLITGFVAVVTLWLSDIKLGMCVSSVNNSWYLSKKFCCWEVDVDKCKDWWSWSAIITGNKDGGLFNFAVYILLGTIMACISFLLVGSFAPYAAGSGLPEIKTILGGFVIHGFLGFKTFAIKVLALCFSIASGLSLGLQAPLVHIACCIGNILPRYFSKYHRNEAKKRQVLSAASAAGIGVAFGAPIAGVLFSLEEVSSYFPMKTLWRSFFCSIIASVALQTFNPYRTGKLVLFQSSYDRSYMIWELFCFVFIGIMGGLYGVVFNSINLWIANLRKNHPFWTAETITWKDWIQWIKRYFYRFKHFCTKKFGLTSDTSDYSYDSHTEYRNLGTRNENRKWWNPSKSVYARFFQELVIISITTLLVFIHI